MTVGHKTSECSNKILGFGLSCDRPKYGQNWLNYSIFKKYLPSPKTSLNCCHLHYTPLHVLSSKWSLNFLFLKYLYFSKVFHHVIFYLLVYNVHKMYACNALKTFSGCFFFVCFLHYFTVLNSKIDTFCGDDFLLICYHFIFDQPFLVFFLKMYLVTYQFT